MNSFDIYETKERCICECFFDPEQKLAWAGCNYTTPAINTIDGFSHNSGSGDLIEVEAVSEDDARIKLREKLGEGFFHSEK